MNRYGLPPEPPDYRERVEAAIERHQCSNGDAQAIVDAELMAAATMTATPEPACSRYGIKPPWRIDEARWFDMLNVLPPSKWRRMSGGESFHVCEYLSGDIVSWFVRVGTEFYELQDVDSKSHAQLVAACRAVAP